MVTILKMISVLLALHRAQDLYSSSKLTKKFPTVHPLSIGDAPTKYRRQLEGLIAQYTDVFAIED